MQRKKLEGFIGKNESESGYKGACHPHHPSEGSGVTFGPGIDVGSKSPQQVQMKYKSVVTSKELSMMKRACGLRGQQADKFCQQNHQFTLSQESYSKLLENETQFCVKDVDRIMHEGYMMRGYGHLGYSKKTFYGTPQHIKDILVDMRYNGRFLPSTRQIMVPKLCQYEKALKAGDLKKAENILGNLENAIVKIYKNPQVGGLRIDERRGNKVRQFIKINRGDEMKKINENFKDNGSQNFKQHQAKNLLSIENNNNQIGGVDLGFDFRKYQFDGFHSGTQGFSLKNSCDENGVRLQDIVIPLKVLTDKDLVAKNITVSLDPEDPTNPDGPRFRKIYHPHHLEGTPIGDAMIEADYLMKQLNLGVDEHNKPFKYPQSFKDIGLDFESLVKKYPKTDDQIERARLWIVIEDVQIKEDDNGVVQIGEVKMGLRAKTQEIGADGKLADTQGKISRHNEQFVKLFCKHYDLIQKEYPIFWEVKKYAKAATLARLFMQRGCPINVKLIDNLYRKQRREVSKTKNRLENKIHSETLNKVSIRRLSGGCDISIAKPSLMAKKAPLQDISNSKIDLKKFQPFIFQELVKCCVPECSNYCNLDYYSVLYKKCFEHSDMKCFNCLEYFYIGQRFSKVDIHHYHPNCLMCNGCETLLSIKEMDKIKVKNGYLYHQKCYPVGYCSLCKQTITYGEQIGTFLEQQVHIPCFNKWKALYNQILAMTAPKCASCNKPITGSYRSNGVESWHAQCFQQPVCQICGKEKSIVSLGTRRVHLECLKCIKCLKPLNAHQKFGEVSDKQYIHIACSGK